MSPRSIRVVLIYSRPANIYSRRETKWEMGVYSPFPNNLISRLALPVSAAKKIQFPFTEDLVSPTYRSMSDSRYPMGGEGGLSNVAPDIGVIKLVSRMSGGGFILRVEEWCRGLFRGTNSRCFYIICVFNSLPRRRTSDQRVA